MEIVDVMINFDEHELYIYADTTTDQFIENCNSCLVDSLTGEIIKEGTCEQVTNYAYKNGYRW